MLRLPTTACRGHARRSRLTAMTAVFIESSSRCLSPFGEPAAEAPILQRPLRQWLEEALAAAGLTRVSAPVPPCMIVPDNAFLTATAIQAFLSGAAGRDATLVLGKSAFGKSLAPLQPHVTETPDGWRFSRIRWVSGRGEEPVDVVIDPAEKIHPIGVPAAFLKEGEATQMGLPLRAVAEVHHWSHLLTLNHLARAIELRQVPKIHHLPRVLSAFLRARSLNRWKLLGKLNRIDPGCDIHPTAVVEASRLARGVRIGPHARVFFSNLGEGAEVMSHAAAEFTTLGAGAVIAQNAIVRLSLLYPGAVAAQSTMQKCVLGRRAVAATGSYCFDLNLDREIRVEMDGHLQSCGSRLLGVALGHGAFLGCGVHVASGREIPNHRRVLLDPSRVISRIDPQPPC